MFKTPEMRVSDYSCLLCGSKLGLAMTDVIVGDNCGCCPMCNEPFIVNITADEMKDFLDIEKKHKREH
jgi:hypothetical protein